ncbi:MAG TPA: GAF domain-containing protein, partial [Anaerolineales bacterium]|nr:GAF domain-containing protein [Anaerolineales bacterium]
ELKYRTLVEQLPMMVYTNLAEDVGFTTFISPQVESILGYTQKEWLENPEFWTTTLHPEDYARVMAEVERVHRTSEPFDLEYRMIAQDGRVLWFRDQAVLVQDREGNPPFWQGLMTDITEKKQMEEALRESEEHFRSVYENATIGLYRTTPDGQILMSNSALVKMLGFESFEELAKINLERDGSHAIYKRKEFKDRIERDGEIRGLESAWRRRDDAPIYVRESARVVRDAEGKTLYYEGTVEDITDHRKAEADLLQSHSLLQAAFESTADGLLVVDAKGKITYFNRQFIKMWGIPDSVIASRDDDQALSFVLNQLQNPDGFLSKVRELYSQPEAESFDLLEFKDGRVFERYSQPQRIGNEVVGRVWSFRDVTSSKQTQENLLASETELRALFAAIPDVILVLDKDGHYVKVAPTGADPLYVPTDEMLGKRMHDIFSQQKAEELVSHIHLALQTRRPVQFEYALLIEGHIVWFSGAAAPLTEDRVIWVARDITSQKQAEDQVERRLTDLEVLYESGISLSQSLDPRAVGEKVINVLAKRLNWHHAAVRIRRGDSDEVELLAFSQSQERNGKAQSNQMIARNAITKVGEGMTGWVIQHGRTINSGDLKSDPRYHETFPGMRSGLYVPIWAGGRTLGCISVESDQPELFNEADERLLTTLASQAASALENARLFESERLRRQDAETLRQAASAVSSSLDPQKVLDELLDGLAKVIAYDSSTVFILENKKIRAVSGRGLVAPEKVIGRLFPSDDTLTKEIMATHRPVALEDVQKDARFEDWGTDEPVRSWMGVPLMARGAPIGYLTLDRKEVAPYSEAEAEMALAFANHAAAAIENARLYQDAIRSAERRAALHTASQEIGQIGQDLEEIYASIHRAAERLMPTEAFAITLADEEHQEIEGVYLIDHGGRSLVMRLPSGKGLSGKVIEKGESILINDDLENQVEGIHFGSKEAVRSILAVPMRVGGRVIGMISAQSYQPNQYTEEDQYLLETLAAQAGVAIENTRLFKETTRRADQFAALYEVTRSVSSKRDLDNLLHTITEQAIALLSAGGGGIYLYNAEHEDLELITNVDSQVQPGIRLKLGEGAAGQVAVTREPIIIEDYQTWEGRSLQYQGQQIRAVLEVPMLHGGELLGVLTVEEHGESERKFTPTDASVLSLFAAHAASAIHNARLFEQITLRAGEFEALYQTASDVSLQGDLQTLLKTIIERARVLSLAQGASLYLFDSERGDLDLVAALDPDLRLGTRLEMGEGLAGRVAQLKEPVVVEDYQTWEHRSSKYQGFPVTSILGVPMLYSGELVGVLSVFNRAVGNEQGTRASLFTQHEADLLSLFANVAGGAVYSARLMDQTRRRLEELDALAKVSSALRTASTRNEMIPVILNQLREILHADSAIFTALNPDTHEIVVELAQGTLEVHTGLVIPPNEGLTARVIESRKVYVKSDFQSEPNVFAAHLLKDVRSVMIAPLATQERAIGALWVTREEREGIFPPPFAGHELNLMTSIADIAANAIQRASLHEQTTDYADQLVTINTIGHALSETLDLPGIYEKVSRSVLELLPDTANVYITLYDWQTRTIAPGYALREGRAADVSRMAPIKLDDVRDWNQAKVVSNGAPLVIPALDDQGTGMQSVHGWAAGDNPMGSALYVPLKAEGRVIGVLQLQSLTKNRYNQADASLLELIANTAGVAIQNTRL